DYGNLSHETVSQRQTERLSRHRSVVQEAARVGITARLSAPNAVQVINPMLASAKLSTKQDMLLPRQLQHSWRSEAHGSRRTPTCLEAASVNIARGLAGRPEM